MKAERVETVAAIRARVARARGRGKTVALVPTMGALHTGHGELIRRARSEADFVVVSVFVNPIQFNSAEDFELYPRTLETDIDFCGRFGADAVFAPSAREMYPEPQLAFVEVSSLGDSFCGEFRPGHFRGVATVVAKLLNIVQPDRAYFGEKDAQQLAVIRRMVADLNLPIAIIPVATVREPDGLAMSSRNARLKPEDRAAAPLIYEALQAAARAVAEGGAPEKAKRAGMEVLARDPRFQVEYFECADPATMKIAERISGPVLILAAVWLGGVRLIDNILCGQHRSN